MSRIDRKHSMGREVGQGGSPPETKTAERKLHLTRLFEAPRSLVWRAWTDGRLVAKWWGPRMFGAPVCEVEARSGGAIRIHMRGPDGTIYPMTGVFHEVVEPERLVFSGFAFLSLDSDPVLETHNSVLLEEVGGKTRITVDVAVVRAAPEAEMLLAGMEQGWNEQLDRLEEELGAPKREGRETVKSFAPNPALKELGVLVGRWEVVLSNARFLPDSSATLLGSASFEWIEGGDFLIMRQGIKGNGAPYSTSVIGRDESEEEYAMLYLDERGVSRIYAMSFRGREWRQWRDAPGFRQRFKGTLSEDGNTVEASWEMSGDGAHWVHDFDLTYRRKA